jgi:hypothetical protein
MIRIILATISVFCFTQSVSAQSNGPLGFTWGGGNDQLKSIEKIDFSKEYNILSETDQYFCAAQATANLALAPEGWKTDYRNYVKPRDMMNLEWNSAKADKSMDGRLTAYLYNVDVLGVQMKACGAFLDDQLYSIAIENRNFLKTDAIMSLVKDAIIQTYGDGKSLCSSICSSNWISEERKVFINWITGGRINGLTYFYGPIKSQQIESWASYYMDFVKSSTKGSDL